MTISMETKPNSPPYIIADSSALISLVVTTDINNKKARSIVTAVSKAENIIVIPSEVFAETINLLGKKFTHTQAMEAASLLLNADLFIIKPTTAVMRQNALKEFGGMPKSVSYTDCLVISVADTHGTTNIFGFDDIFRKSGYRLPPTK
jgi:predicted nucleic acid-binding protein